jgi:hypothetical protein
MKNGIFWDVTPPGSCKNLGCYAVWLLQEPGMLCRVALLRTLDVMPCGSSKNLGCYAVWLL